MSGEDSLTTALRETDEEIGLKLAPEDLRFLKTVFSEGSHANYMIDIYKVTKDVDLATLRLDESEVKAVSYASKDKIFQMMQDGQFWHFEALLPDIRYFDILEEVE